MSHPYVGPLSAYNSLTDKHLTGYFNNTRIRRHLQRAGLVTRSGRILTEKEFKINSMRRDHQKYIRQCLAQAIFQKVLDMERNHQIEIKRKLETFARRERIQRIKADHSKTVEEETFALFSPRPPTGPKSGVTRQMITQKELSDSSDSVSSPRPNTAPGNMQRPVRLQPIQGYCPSRTAPKTSSGLRQKESADEQEQQFPRGVDRDLMKLMNAMDHSTGVSPYRLPIINNFVIPAPPPQRKYPKQLKQTVSTSSRGRRFRPTTAPNGLELTSKDSGKFHKTILHSNVAVTMVYLGKNVHLSHDDNDFRDEIKVFQQHCGGENLCVFKGRLQEGETFNLISRRHRGFPFSLTFYINGMQVDRLSSCCEYKHRKGARLGGKNGYFGFVNIEGASPCYRCIIAMGLDKKPSPPPKKAKDEDYDSNEEKENVRECESIMDKETIDDMERDEECEEDDNTREKEIEDTSSVYDKTDMEDEEEQDKEYEGGKKEDQNDEYEADDEAKDEYDEDFEVEEEKPDEKTNEEGQVDDQVNGKSKSPSDDEKDDLDHEGESNKPSKEATETSDSEKDERDGHSDSEYEEDKQGKHSITDKEMNIAARKIQLFYREHRTHQQNIQKMKTDGRSVQEKIAEAIDHEEHFNSEPEPSDSSTDEEDNFKNAFHGSKSSLEQTSLNETEELIEQNNTERSTSRADSMTLEAASESVNLQTVNEESLTRSATFNDLENGSQNIDEHIQDEEATAGEELKQAEDAVEESKQPDELIDNGESTNDTISVEVATDCEKKELESLHEELTNNENDIEAQLETPEIEGDIEIQNNSDVCAPDAGEIKEEKLDDQNAEEQNIPLEESGDATGNEVKDEEAVENGDITINEDHDLSAETSTTLNMENEDAGFSNDTKGEEEEDHIEEHERTGTLTTEEENIAVTSDSVDEVEETENQLVQEEEQHASENEIAEDSAKNDDLSEGNVDKEQTEDGIQAIDDTAIELSDNNENVTKEEQNENNDNEYADTSHDEVVACTNTENLTSSVTEEGEAVVLLEPSDSVKTENEVHSEFTGAENASRAVSPETNDSTKCIAIDANSNEEQTAEDNGLPNDQGEAKENEESTNGEEVHQAEISDTGNEMENVASSVMVEDEDKEQTEDGIQEIADTATELPDTSEDVTEEEQNENNDNEGTDTSHDAGNEVDSCTDMENLTSSVTVEDEDKEQTEDSIQEIAETATELPDTSEDITEEEQNENNDNEGTGTSHDAGNEGDSCTDMENVTSSIMVEEEDKEQAEDDIQEIADTSADLPETNEDITEQEQSENNDEGADTSNDADNELDPCNDMENVPNSVTEEEEPELVEPSDILTTENEDISAENASIAVSPDTHDSNECIVIEDDNSKEEHTTEESSENNALSSHQDDGNQDVSDLSRDDANLEEEQTTEESSENNGLPSDPDDGNQDINGDTENLINEKEVESVNEEMQLQSQDVAVKDDMANVMEAFSDETEKAIECDNNDVEHTDPSTEEHSANDSSKEMASAPEDSGLETQDESSDVNAVSGDMTSKTEDEPDNVAENNLLDDEEGTDNKDNSSNADQLGQEESLTSDVNENEHNQDDIVNESASENNEEDTPAEMCSSEQDSVNNIASLDQDNENTIEQSTETKEESSSVNEEAAETGDVVSTDINNVAGAEKLEEEIDAESTIENVSINNLHETDANSNEENGETEENADSKEEDVSQIVDEEEIKNTGALEPETSQSERADNDKPEIEQEATPVTEFSESSENIEESKEEEGEVNETDQDISPNDAENTLPNDKTEEILNVSELGTVNSIPDNEISQTENEDPI